MDGLAFLVKVLDNRLGVVHSRSRKHIDGVELGHLLEELEAIRSHIELELVTPHHEADVGFFRGED